MFLGENKSAAMLTLENFMRTVGKHRDSFGNLLLATVTHVSDEHGQWVGVSPGHTVVKRQHRSRQPPAQLFDFLAEILKTAVPDFVAGQFESLSRQNQATESFLVASTFTCVPPTSMSRIVMQLATLGSFASQFGRIGLVMAWYIISSLRNGGPYSSYPP